MRLNAEEISRGAAGDARQPHTTENKFHALCPVEARRSDIITHRLIYIASNIITNKQYSIVEIRHISVTIEATSVFETECPNNFSVILIEMFTLKQSTCVKRWYNSVR